jgi:hypothetical protein
MPTRSSAGSPTWLRLGWLHSGLIIVLIMALSLTFLFGIRSYRTLVLLQSAQQLGVVETSSIRAWMTLQYVAATYDVDEDVLVTQLQLPTRHKALMLQLMHPCLLCAKTRPLSLIKPRQMRAV